MRPIKVLYIIDTLGTEKFGGGGAESSIIEIAIQNKGVIPYFISVYKGVYLASLLQEHNIYHVNLGLIDKYGFKKAVEKILPLIEEIQPDVMHSTLARADFIARKLKKKTGLPLINSLVSNSYSPDRFKNMPYTAALKLKLVQWRNRLTAHIPDGFISNSQSIKDSFIKTLGLQENKITVIHRGRDFEKMHNFTEEDQLALRKELNLKESDFLLLNVGRLIESKGQKDLLLAFAKIKDTFPHLKLLIAGEGPYRKNLEEIISEHQLNETVQLLGVRKDIPVLHSIATVFVFPTYLEGLPGSLIEAMMAGKIIICSNIAENLECVSNQEALIVETGDVNALAEQITEVLINPNNFKELTKNAIVTSRLKFEIGQVCKKYTVFYEDILNSYSCNFPTKT